VKWTQAAQDARNQGDHLRADGIQSYVNKMLAILEAKK
jgi:hypothetical protein